mmetsp:Transcript_414/g.1263  ORF Transcript_414/g.1263 Transcript_414/m.1263 type:complete len:357 (+) Transcript_414:710-1780(+)
MIAAFEILELFCELLNVRLQLIDKTKEIPSDMREAVASIIYAARRVPEVPEVGQLSQQLANKYGKEFAQSASGDDTCRFVQVNEKLIDCLSVLPPNGQLKLDLLAEIAREYNVTNWDYELARRQLVPDSASPAGLMAAPPPAAYQNFTVQGSGSNGTNGGGPSAGDFGVGGSGGGLTKAAQPAVPSYPPSAAPEPTAASYTAPPPSQAPQASVSRPPPPMGPAASWPPPAPSMPADAAPTDLPTFSWAKPKTDEEIQRNYDAAQGPPEKGAPKAMGGPASAPPMPPPSSSDSLSGSVDLPNPPANAPAPLPHPPGRVPGARPDLPTIPPTGPQPGAPAQLDELDELNRRFNALRGR